MEKRVFDQEKFRKINDAYVDPATMTEDIMDFIDSACKSYACEMLEKVRVTQPGYQDEHGWVKRIDALISQIKEVQPR